MTKRTLSTLLTVMIVALLASSIPVQAGTSINMFTSSAVRLADNSLLPIGSLVQLIWSATATYATPIAGSIPTAGGQYANGAYVLFSGATASLGGFNDTQMDGAATYQNAAVGAQNILNGYVYVFVFATSYANVQAGTFYARSTISGTPLPDVDKTPTPDQPLTFNVSPSPGMKLDTLTVAPEPTTLSLFGVGLLAMAFRRFRKA